MPTLRALECFVAVADAGSITAGAARLHLSQPALSHQLASLEAEIGTPLLERQSRGVRPTPTGRAVLVDARATLAAAGRVLTTGRALAAGTEGRLRLACAESLTVPLLAPTLRAWTRKYRTVDLDLTEFASADAMADAVTNGDVDLAVGPASERYAGTVVDLGTEDVVAVVPEGLDLADSDAVSGTSWPGGPSSTTTPPTVYERGSIPSPRLTAFSSRRSPIPGTPLPQPNSRTQGSASRSFR